jgi:mRNA interferase YafQ
LRSIYSTNKFKKDYQRMAKRQADIEELNMVIEMLANDIPLDQKYNDHPLKGMQDSTRDCHIQNDWILIYEKNGKTELHLIRTGSHADLFK